MSVQVGSSTEQKLSAFTDETSLSADLTYGLKNFCGLFSFTIEEGYDFITVTEEMDKIVLSPESPRDDAYIGTSEATLKVELVDYQDFYLMYQFNVTLSTSEAAAG